jgi:death-on-curing family protein
MTQSLSQHGRRLTRHRLAECRGCVEVEAFGERKYPDLPAAAAKLFYSTIKLHPFPNGNKRFALVLSFVLLLKNGYMLRAPDRMGARVAKLVAESDPHDPKTTPDKMIEALTEFFGENMAPYQERVDETGQFRPRAESPP